MIRIDHLNIRLGEFNLHDINLHINEGEYFVLLGPTGAGKSVLLECIAGIYKQDTGRILINGQEVTRRYPEERNLGYVPQDYALFPNMTVRQNLGYGLKARKWKKQEIQENVDAMMEQLKITHLQNRYPLHLSGGEKQRVALGRALATGPGLLLLDEPLSALDENLRAQLAEELLTIQRDANRMFLHVCHSFDEASYVADRIAIMRQGVIEQVGTIQEILAKPSSLFIAEFTRMRNFQTGIAEKVGLGTRITISPDIVLYSVNNVFEGPVTFGIRPEEIALSFENSITDRVNHLKAKVVRLRFRPSFLEIELDVGFSLITYNHRQGHHCYPEHIAEGDTLWVDIDPDAIAVFQNTSD